MGSSLFGSGDTRSILVQRSSLLGLVIFLAGSLGIVRGQSVDPATRSSAEQMQTLLPFIAGGTGIVSPPTIDAADDVYHTLMNTPLVVDAAGGVLANDTGAGPLQAVMVDDVSHGDLTLDADGSFTYTPAPQFVGEDSFTYRAEGGTAPSNVATVRLIVTKTDPPLAMDDAYETPQDTALTVDAPASVSSSASEAPRWTACWRRCASPATSAACRWPRGRASGSPSRLATAPTWTR